MGLRSMESASIAAVATIEYPSLSVGSRGASEG